MNWFRKLIRSLPIVHWYPPIYPTWDDGKQRGPFWFSNAWRNPANHDDLLFFTSDNKQKIQKTLVNAAFNKSYNPPNIAIYLARDYIQHLETENKRWKAEAIAAKKQISQLKRK